MKKIIRLTESDLARIVNRVLNEQVQSTVDCLIDAGFTREDIGGPMTRRIEYQKSFQGFIYNIPIIKQPSTPSKELTIIGKNSGGTKKVCSSWSCDKSRPLGIKFSGCVQKPNTFD